MRLVVAMSVLFPALAVCQERCQWMNAATAAGFLGGGAVRAAFDNGSCTFTRQDGSHEYVLRIEVRPLAAEHARCPAGSVGLKGIGNEAQACSHAETARWMAEQVVGRVRDQAFLVRVASNDPAVAAAALREKSRAVAEQVAGILY